MSRVEVKHVRRNEPTATPVADGLAPCIKYSGLLSPDIIAKVMLRELLIAIRQTQTLAYTEFITIFLLVKIAISSENIFLYKWRKRKYIELLCPQWSFERCGRSKFKLDMAVWIVSNAKKTIRRKMSLSILPIFDMMEMRWAGRHIHNYGFIIHNRQLTPRCNSSLIQTSLN